MPNADYKLNSPGHDINKYLFPFSFSQFPSPNSVHWNLEFINYNIKNVRRKIKSVVVTNSSQLWEILDYLKAYLELMEGYVIKQLEYNLGSKRYGNRSSLSGKKKKNKNNVKQYSMHLRDKVKVIHLCLTLWDPMDCSLPGSCVREILQARILEWVAMPSSRGSSQPRDRAQVSHTAGRFFTINWAQYCIQFGRWVGTLNPRKCS